MIRILIFSLLLAGCGGSSGEKSDPVITGEVSCLANDRNCSDEDVDLNSPVRWAADNGVDIVHIRWAGCSDEEASKYAYERGVTIICLAADDGKLITENSEYTITVGSSSDNSNYGPGVDYVMGRKGTVHSGIWATALVSVSKPLGNYSFEGYSRMSLPSRPVMIVDNGFDHRPIYVLYKNPVLAGEITGDYGIKALNELSRWVNVDVIGYVPFNTLPSSPRIDNWEEI